MDRSPPAGRPPQLGRLLERPELLAYLPRLSRPIVAELAENRLAEARASFLAGGASPGIEELAAQAAADCAALARRRIRRTLNATGVILHPDLGRSPLGEGAWEAARGANAGYANLEFDLEAGTRGNRGGLVPRLAARLAGAEDAIAVNNASGAVLLALAALAAGREVLVSRGELAELCGGFRVPEALALAGARLVEVGTTNVTRVEDYLRALGPEVAAVLVVRRADFALRGHASSPSLGELARALPPGVGLLVDQGSGCAFPGLPGEYPFAEALEAGAELVCFSADKLLGGPQAGLACGRTRAVEAMAAHPLARALRPGKTVLSLLEERLVGLLNGEEGPAEPPEPAELESYGRKVLRRLPAGTARLVPSSCALGSGAAPDESFESRALAVEAEAASRVGGARNLLEALRRGEPPLVAIAREGKALLDLAALRDEDPAEVAACLASALGLEPGDKGPGGHGAPARKRSPARRGPTAASEAALDPAFEPDAEADAEAELDLEAAEAGEGLLAKALRFEGRG